MEASGTHSLVRHSLGLQRPMSSIGNAIADFTTQELNALIGEAAKSRNLDDLAALVYHRLQRRGAAHSASLILMAEDLYLLNKHGLWRVSGYPTWAEWVETEFSSQPYGKDYSTVMAMINVWRFYAVQCGWQVEDLIIAGKAKLERALALARATAEEIKPERPLQIVRLDTTAPVYIVDEVLRRTLLDTDVSHANVIVEYESRVATREAIERVSRGEDDDGGTATKVQPQRTAPMFQANSATGKLVVWLPMNAGRQDVAIELGTLNFTSEKAQPWLSILLNKAQVKVK